MRDFSLARMYLHKLIEENRCRGGNAIFELLRVKSFFVAYQQCENEAALRVIEDFLRQFPEANLPFPPVDLNQIRFRGAVTVDRITLLEQQIASFRWPVHVEEKFRAFFKSEYYPSNQERPSRVILGITSGPPALKWDEPEKAVAMLKNMAQVLRPADPYELLAWLRDADFWHCCHGAWHGALALDQIALSPIDGEPCVPMVKGLSEIRSLKFERVAMRSGNGYLVVLDESKMCDEA